MGRGDVWFHSEMLLKFLLTAGDNMGKERILFSFFFWRDWQAVWLVSGCVIASYLIGQTCSWVGESQPQMKAVVACPVLVLLLLSLSACFRYALLMFAAVVHETFHYLTVAKHSQWTCLTGVYVRTYMLSGSGLVMYNLSCLILLHYWKYLKCNYFWKMKWKHSL